MPIVPTVTGRQVESRGVSTNGFSAHPYPNVGDVLADATGKYVGVLAEAKQRANVALSQDAALQLSQRASVMMNDPQKGLLTLQGKSAIGKGQEYTRLFDGAVEEIAITLPDDNARNAFYQQAQQQRIQFTTQAGRHEIGQINAYEEGQFKAVLSNTAESASMLFSDNTGYISANQQAFQQIERFGAAHGWSDEQILAKKTEFKEKAAMSAGANALGANYMAVRAENGEPSDNQGSTRSPGTGPRGIRNNNPGNIRISKNAWVGQSGDDGSFVTFATPEHGIRALGKNLLTYQRLGYVTPRQIITRWAPPSDNNATEEYIEHVSQALKVSADAKLDLRNIGTLSTLTRAIMAKENGVDKVKYSDEQINIGLQAALGYVELSSPEGAPKRYTGTAWFDALNPADQAKILRQSDAMLEQQRSQHRSELVGRVKDASAAYMRGVDFPNPPAMNDFVQAYGYNDGVTRFADFQKLQQLGADIGVVKTLPVNAQLALLEARKPAAGDGYAAAAERHDSLTQAIKHVNTARQDDPIRYAQGQSRVSSLDFGNLQSFSSSLAQRADTVPELSAQYQTPLTVFSKEESTQLTTLMKNAPASQQAAYLDAMRQSIRNPVVYKAALQQISSGSPSFAVAGIIMDKPTNIVTESNIIARDTMVTPSDAAKLILEGNQARKGSEGMKGIPMPKDTDLRTAFSDYVGDAFAGDTQGAEAAYQVALDFYAGRGHRAGDISGEYNEDRFEEAMTVATGGIHDYQGMGKVMLPWGMDSDDFDRAVVRVWKRQVLDKGIKTEPIKYGLQSFGDSRYLVKSGAGYLSDSQGNPVVLDLTESKMRDIPE